jgi:hypothetical protein
MLNLSLDALDQEMARLWNRILITVVISTYRSESQEEPGLF